MPHLRALLLLLLLLPDRAPAQSGSIPLSQWQHSSWTGDEGPLLPVARSMLRSSDGYLWLGSLRGLIRFDGIRFTLIDSSYSALLRPEPTATYDPVLLDRSGKLWITTPHGTLLSYRNGQFRVEQADSGYVHAVAEDRLGRIWVAVDTRLRLLRNGHFEVPALPVAVPDSGVLGVVADSATGIWIGTLTDGLWHVMGNAVEHHGTGRKYPLLTASDGTVWLANEAGPESGLMRLKGGSWSRVNRPDGYGVVTAGNAIEGPDGSVWLTSFSTGVLRWRNGSIEQFSTRDGLSSNTAKSLFVSAEGAVWVTTDAGLDRLRPAAFASIDAHNGLPYETFNSFALDSSGALWSSARNGALYLHDGGAIRHLPGPITTSPRILVGTSGDYLQILTASPRGGVWLAPLSGGLIYYNGRVQQRFDHRNGLPADRAWTAFEGRDGTLWMKPFLGHLGRLRDGTFRTPKLPGSLGPDGIVEDAIGRIWIAPTNLNAVLALAGDSVVRRVSLPGPDAAPIMSLTFERGDTLWAAGLRSLFRIAGGQAVEVRVPGLSGILEAVARLAITQDQLWVASESGIARLSLSDLHRAADGDTAQVTPTFFNALDGLPSPRSTGGTRRSLRVGPDGRLWIATPTGFAVTDGSRPAINPVAPVIHIEEVSLAGTRISMADGGTLPPNPERFTIRYSAPNLGLPERVRVEYQLQGVDQAWVEGKPPRVVVYNQLRPGPYRFRVRAWNEDGVASTGETTLTFRVLPAWYQSRWFLALCILGTAAIGAAIAAETHRRRSQRTAAGAQARFETVLAERTRLARELHDTLLQGFTGITLQLDGVRGSLHERAEPEAEELSQILLRADKTLREAREMVWDMRQPALTHDKLNEALRLASATFPNPGNVTLQHIVTGVPRPLAPTVVTTILRIGKEAVVNALKHAQASSIVVHLTYEPRRVLLEVLDDGRGCAPDQLDAATAGGHWGVAGMRERARSAGGALSLTTAPDEGTRIAVTLPAEPLG